ncbi:TolC family protein [Puniceicoccales bacterium CK1056]|uniref:TolC family protein n=1 Tax=Oceanipulchritudo coccoides TaxID=2706888 RepID=A0A6B2M378_9BACT|nr:TolC family protein [Oceanipulchritudo coccoides]NDV62866.1 TolC family protein [Oceanipulchritudo coccoides]
MKISLQILSAISFAGIALLNAATSPEVLDYETVIQLARANNYAIQQAEAQLEEAEGRSMTARAGRLPAVDLVASYSRIDENRLETFGGSAFGDSQSWSADIQATQPLYTGGAVTSSIRGTRAAQSSAEAQFNQTLQDAMLAVHQSWYAVLLAREEVVVRAASIELLQKQLKQAEDRFETGSVSRFDLLRAEVALANGRPPYIRAQNQYRLTIVDLLQVLGLEAPAGTDPEIEGELVYAPLEMDLAEALSIAKQNRPEFLSLDKLIEASEAEVKGAKAGYLPNLNLVAGYGVQKSNFSDELDDTVEGWTVGVQGSWRIWDAKATKGSVLSARSRLRQSELARDELDLQVGTEVRQALSSIQEAKELVESSRKVVEQAEEVLSLAEDRYSVGSAIQLEVLEAQLSLTEARTNEVQALHDYSLAAVRLERALGTL